MSCLALSALIFRSKEIIKNKKLSYNVSNKTFKDPVSNLGLNPGEFGSHSAQSGGAAALLPFITQFELMLSGRWSDAHSIGSYVETLSSTRFEIHQN